MQSITACLIVKDESRVIERCLKSLKGVNEIIVLDTGSKDATPQICTQNKAKVTYDIWRDDFAEARNKALEYCTGDWILSIDADEYLTPGTLEFIREFIKKNKGEVFSCYVKTDETLSVQSRIFKRNLSRTFWKSPYHECLNRQADNHINIEIVSTNQGNKQKTDPDMGIRILRKHLQNNPNDAREMYYLGKEYQARCQYELAIFWLGEADEVYPAPGGRAEIQLSMAKCYIHLKRYRKAINHLHEAIKINPEIRECYTLLNTLTKKPIYAKFADQAKNTGMNIVNI